MALMDVNAIVVRAEQTPGQVSFHNFDELKQYMERDFLYADIRRLYDLVRYCRKLTGFTFGEKIVPGLSGHIQHQAQPKL